MINNILNSSQVIPLTIEKNNINNNFNVYSTTNILLMKKKKKLKK